MVCDFVRGYEIVDGTITREISVFFGGAARNAHASDSGLVVNGSESARYEINAPNVIAFLTLSLLLTWLLLGVIRLLHRLLGTWAEFTLPRGDDFEVIPDDERATGVWPAIKRKG